MWWLIVDRGFISKQGMIYAKCGAPRELLWVLLAVGITHKKTVLGTKHCRA